MVQQSRWAKKRRSDSARAKTQQRARRRRSIFKKAAEYALECESDILVVIQSQTNGHIYTFNSSDMGRWLATLSGLVGAAAWGFYFMN